VVNAFFRWFTISHEQQTICKTLDRKTDFVAVIVLLIYPHIISNMCT